jgi:uncharacterized protein (TIGR03663 family)
MNAQAIRLVTTDHAGPQARPPLSAHPRAWLAAAAAVLAVAAFVRLYALELRPLHHDEGVNAFFMTQLFNGGGYHYDPANYHGPTLYYLALVAARAQGLTIFAMRLVPAVCGIAAVWLILCLRRHVGTFGALAGAGLLAVSPGAVYMSRYFIHESLFVFFTLGAVVAGFRYAETGKSIYLMCASVAAGLVLATKETAIISAAVLVMAIFLTPMLIEIRDALGALRRPSEPPRQAEATGPRPTTDVQIAPRRPAQFIRPLLKWAAAGGLFILVIATFYSALFTNRQWLGNILKSYQYWARAGRSEHLHSWYVYFVWLMREDGLLSVAGLIGAGLIIWRSNSRFLVFAAIWLCGLLGAYSIVPYKTPWLALNFLIPLAILAGYAADAAWKRAATERQRVLVAGGLGLVIAVASYQTVRLNFLEYDDGRHPYVYAHTRREFLSLVAEVSDLADRFGTRLGTTITVTSSEYWPLPWYLRNYRQVAYPEQVSHLDARLVIGSPDQESELQAKLGQRYDRVSSHTLRPGVSLVLYARREPGGPDQ